jgi:hypothetical protein
VRILLLHPRLDTLPGYYGARYLAEQLSRPASSDGAAFDVRADVASTTDWSTIAYRYDVVHLYLSMLDYEPNLLAHVREFVAAGGKVLVEIDVEIDPKTRLGYLRKQLVELAGYAQVMDAPQARTDARVVYYEKMQLVPHLTKTYTRPKQPFFVVGVYPTTDAAELTYLRNLNDYLQANPATTIRWLILGGAGSAPDQERVEVVPCVSFSQDLRALGKQGLEYALKLYNPRHASIPQLVRNVPKGVTIPEHPFLTVRKNYDVTPANQTLQALGGKPADFYQGATRATAPRQALQQLSEVDVLLLPSGRCSAHQATEQLLAQLAVQVGTYPMTATGSARDLARSLAVLAATGTQGHSVAYDDDAVLGHQVATYRSILTK